MVATFIRNLPRLSRVGKDFVSSQQTSIMSAATVISALTVLSALLGLVRSRFLVGYVSRVEVEAFLVAFRIPDFLFQLLVAGVLSATFIPIFTRVNHQDPRQARNLVNTLVSQLSVIYIVFSLIVGIFAEAIIRRMTGSGFSDAQVVMAASMTRVMLASTFFLLLSNFLSGILQSSKHFLLPALSPVLYNLGIIFGIVFLTPRFGIMGPALGVVIGSLVHFLVQLPLSSRLGFALRSFRPNLSLKNLDVREVYRLMVPRGATLTTNYVEDFVGLYVATSIGNTFVLIYTLASQLMAAPIRLFGVSIAQAALPFFSIRAKERDMVGFMKLLVDTLSQISFFMYPASVLLLVLRIPIVRLAFGARKLPWSDTVLLGRLVAVYSLSIAALAMTHVVLRAYYALKETKVPFIFATISMVVNIVIMLAGAFVFKLGLPAVALGPTVAAVLELLLLLIFMFKKVGYFSARQFFLPQAKMLLATFLMGIALYVPMKFLDQLVFDTTRVLGLLALTAIVSCLGVIVYLSLSKLLRVEQLSIMASIQGKLKGWQARLSESPEIFSIEEETQHSGGAL